jgi:F0F1-type ATP synthase membrane subunit a
MGNPRIRGLVFLAVGSLLAWFLCVFPSFTALPNAGLAIALPVITVPGEVVHYNWIGSFHLTNTLLGGFLASALVLLWAGLSYRATNGWTREVPDRWQAWTEWVVESAYNFMAGIGGDNFKKAPLLWPFVAAILFFLLAGNLGKLFPGFESVGYIHCGYEGFSGYARINNDSGKAGRLWVDRALDSGVTQTYETEQACLHQMKVLDLYYGKYNPDDYAEEREAYFERLEAIQGVEVASATPLVDGIVLTSTLQTEEDHGGDDAAADEFENVPATGTCLAHETGAMAAAEEAAVEGGELGEDEAHGEEEAAPADEEESHDSAGMIVLTSTLATEEDHGEDDAHSDEDKGHAETVDPEVVAVAFAELLAAEEANANGELTDYDLEAVRCAVTDMMHPGAIFPMSAQELQQNRIQPYVFTVAPWFRGVSTDLSFNIGLAVMALVLVQVYGVIALGPAYFDKFLPLGAIGNMGKKPTGAIDFIVGVLEIISELGKIVSLAFRLFGNIFAGGIVLVIFSFLIAFILPGVMVGLEIIIGTVQALVFAVLMVVYATSAMEAHHHDDDHDHDEHH